MMKHLSVWKFSDFDWFYDQYQPLTPYGRVDKAAKNIYDKQEALESLYQDQESVLFLLSESHARQAQLEACLTHIPELPLLGQTTYTAADIFLVKKYLINLDALTHFLNDKLIRQFDFTFDLQDLFYLLTHHKKDLNESFHLSAHYSQNLSHIRKQIDALDSAIKENKETFLKQLFQEQGLDFNLREFLVLPAEDVSALPTHLVSREPYDAVHYIVRPVFPSSVFTLQEQRAQLVIKERSEEQVVFKQISQAINQSVDSLKRSVLAVTQFDTALARARLIKPYKMVRPHFLKSTEHLKVTQGRYLPLEHECQKDSVTYWPLNVTADTQASLLFGSNMGGKTVVLKSLGFFQLLAQMGFFVPAKNFSTTVFKQISYLGPLGSFHEASLSGFGHEISMLNKVWDQRLVPALYLIDEFAHTTNSFEAEAFLAGLLQVFTRTPQVLAFISTHFMDLIIKSKKVGLYRMRGLDQSAYKKFFAKSKKSAPADRLKLIHQFMRYEVVREKNIKPIHDAIGVASLLGLDTEIIKEAKKYLEKKDKT